MASRSWPPPRAPGPQPSFCRCLPGPPPWALCGADLSLAGGGRAPVGTCRRTGRAGPGRLSTPNPSPWQSCPGLPARRRTLQSRRWAPPAPRPPLLAGRSPAAPSRSPARACGSGGTLGSRALRRGRARAVSAVRGAGWGFPEPPLAGAFSGFSALLSSPNSGDRIILTTGGVPCSSPLSGKPKSNADSKARPHRPWLLADGPGAGTASSTALCFAGALLSKLCEVCLVMGSGFPRNLGR